LSRLVFRRTDFVMAAALAGAVVSLDLLWSLIAGSTGALAYGLVDEPAHLATCGIALLALAAATGRLPTRFVAAALVGSVAIDVDHIPGYLGSSVLHGNLPRPYTHCLLLVVALLAVGLILRRRDARLISLGLAFGIASHLFRDLATGPGVPLLWPMSSSSMTIPYPAFVAGLLLGVGATIGRARARRLLPAVALIGAMALAVLLAPTAARAAPASKISLGAYIPGASNDPALIDAYGDEVGQSPVIVSTYAQWPQPILDDWELEPIWARGAVPMITWEPWTSSESGYSLRGIAKGRFDGYIRQSARAAAAWGKPILLRFAHEMNGGWYPWGRGHGNGPRLFKRAWRHVVRVFRELGATNVRWVWSPYVTYGGRFRFARYFPGNRWVDWVGLDGFNWARNGRWQSFKSIFGESYRILKRMTFHPIMIAETGSNQEGGNKAVWVSKVLNRELPRFSRIRALVWFDEVFHGVDARVDSSPSALSALREAITAWRYRSNRSHLLDTPSHLR
jgi:hypothetical protein